MPERPVALRLYRALLTLYPAAFRARFGDEMVQLFADQLRDARVAGSPTGVAGTWFRSLGDVVSSALSERLSEDRLVAHSLTAPSASTRLLGIAGVIGGLAVLAAFIVQQLIFEDQPWLITVRLLLFSVGAIAVVIGLRRRRPETSRVGALESTVGWATILANAWHAGMVLLPVVGWAPFAGDNHMVAFLAGLALWIADAMFGFVVARHGGFRRGAGLTLALGSILALLGIDRLGLASGDMAALFGPLALVGQGLGGFGWLFLGYDLATRLDPAASSRPKA